MYLTYGPCRMCCCQNKPGTRRCSYSANAKKFHLLSESGNLSCCRLCSLVKNLLNKANEELHAAAEAVYGRSLIFTSEGSYYCVGLVNGDL